MVIKIVHDYIFTAFVAGYDLNVHLIEKVKL